MQEASINAKLSEAVVSGIKTQMEYARMTGREPFIQFLETNDQPRSLQIEKK